MSSWLLGSDFTDIFHYSFSWFLSMTYRSFVIHELNPSQVSPQHALFCPALDPPLQLQHLICIFNFKRRICPFYLANVLIFGLLSSTLLVIAFVCHLRRGLGSFPLLLPLLFMFLLLVDP